MKVHELINVLNHFPPDAEVDVSGNDFVLHGASNRTFSISKTYDTLKDGTGQSLAVTVEPALKPPVNADGLRLDGPTLAEFVAAGYKEENYPPEGYAVRESAAG